MNTYFVGMRTASLAVALALAGALSAGAQTISGSVKNNSTWDNGITSLSTPPGDGSGNGRLIVGLWTSGSDVEGAPFTSSVLSGPAALPLGAGPFAYSLGGALPNGDYQVVAWIDADADGEYDPGEPRNQPAVATIASGQPVVGFNVTVQDDSDADGMPDWWEAHWFQFAANPLSRNGTGDADGDGMSNKTEYDIYKTYGFMLSPATYDTDNDGMDDKWEVDHFVFSMVYGLNPAVDDATGDLDGDGLSNYQEYLGVDGLPRMVFDKVEDGVVVGKINNLTSDDLNPLDIDTDYDMLIDSYEVGWYDPSNRIDPKAGVMLAPPTSASGVDTTIAREDRDNDGLSNFREMCLLAEFRQGNANGFMWTWTNTVPFPQITYQTYDGLTIKRVVLMSTFGSNLNLDLVMNLPTAVFTNRFQLRNQEWTKPTPGTGYAYVDEPSINGSDTDGDFLPDGWEVEFGLDPRDNGVGTGFTNGLFGDPDGDGLLNFQEYLGQDGNRSSTKPLVNGTGDETNPNQHNWRPDSTYFWRWYPTNLPISYLTDPRPGTGISRDETLGSALPTLSIGSDLGLDSDDDGIPDVLEINPTGSVFASSPVHSTDPFIQRSVRITSTNGLVVPDPEPQPASGFMPAGIREDMQRRSWSIEVSVNLQANNMNGDLFRFITQLGPASRTVYRLQLVTNTPLLTAQSSDGTTFTIQANPLPTNQWVHLAATWDHANNSLALYVQGVLFLGRAVFGESASSFLFPATNVIAFGASSDGTFVNNLLLDEIRIWGLARSPRQIADFARVMIPQNNGDDVWLDNGNGIYFGTNDTLLVNGGSLFDGEPGVPLANVLTAGGSYWVDDGNGFFQSGTDIVLFRGATALVEGTPGTPVANVLFNDKDGSGGFTRDSLLAYYRFDDGGATIEDFARKAKNGLLGATSENYLFYDGGYALPTNGIQFATNNAAPILGVDRRGADDSDGDGLPDAWELVNNLNPYDNGTFQETAPGLKNGPNGAFGDPDGDGLQNIYEYWAQTNPRDADTDNNGISDAQEDLDGDGIVNITEQALGSRPDLVDTDDDGVTDNVEQGNGSNPADPADPPVSRALLFGGDPNDYLDVPLSFNQRLTDFTLEALVNPTVVAGNGGTIIRRAIQNLAGGSNAVNYILGVEPNGGTLRVVAGYVQPDGTPYLLRGGSVPAGSCSHLAATYNSLNATLTIYVNGIAVVTTNTFFLAPPVNGRGGEAFVRIGEDFQGVIDEVRVWKQARTATQIATNQSKTINYTDTNLVHYFRFDDGQATNNVLPFSEFHRPAGVQDWTFTKDWNQQWRHAARFNGNVTVTEAGSCIVVSPSLRVILLPPDAVTAGAQWSIDGGPLQNSGVTLTDLTPGPHALSYKLVPNYVAPTNETIVLTNGAAVTITRTYTPYGSLVVVLEPSAARAAGAQYSVNGGPFQDSGSTNILPPGNHVITYKPIAGWNAPSNETVTISSGDQTSLTRFYAGDTDGDGMPDDWEIANGLDPNNPADAAQDPDGDGLSNLDEYLNGTDTHNWDTDGDGVSDKNELLGGSDPLDPNSKPRPKEVNDFDGDGATDLSVYWPQQANWYIRNSSNLSLRIQQWGWSAALPVPADYDGDNRTDVGVMNPADGKWYIYESITRYLRVWNWTWGKVIPVPADYDGDNRADIATYKPENGLWSISFSKTSNTTSLGQSWGWSATQPVPADYDGDSKDDIAVYHPQTGYWYVRQSSVTNGNPMMSGAPIQWGWSAALPVPGDYDGDRRADIAVYHPASGNWYIRKSNNGQLLGGLPFQWGFAGTIPCPGDYDNDGITDIAVYHPATGNWYIRRSSNGLIFSGGPIQFGWSAAKPPRAPANF